jgi:hypothetical protein
VKLPGRRDGILPLEEFLRRKNEKRRFEKAFLILLVENHPLISLVSLIYVRVHGG